MMTIRESSTQSRIADLRALVGNATSAQLFFRLFHLSQLDGAPALWI
jgi:hypothetical protein